MLKGSATAAAHQPANPAIASNSSRLAIAMMAQGGLFLKAAFFIDEISLEEYIRSNSLFQILPGEERYEEDNVGGFVYDCEFVLSK